MIRALLTLLLGISVGVAFSQQQGDYRTDENGNWQQAKTWEVFFNGAWRDVNTTSAGIFRNIVPSSSSGTITITHNVTITNAVTTNQTVIDGNGNLTINNGRVLTINDDGINTPLQINAAARLTNNGTLDLQSQMASTPIQVHGLLASNVTILTSNPSLLIFHPGSRYFHYNKTGGNIPLATWDINSTCEIGGMTRNNPLRPGNLNQSFGNFRWNTPNMGASSTFSLGGLLQNVANDLTVITTGPAILRLGYTGPGINLTVGGDIIILGGSVMLANNHTSTSNITINGNLIISAGTLTLGNNNSATNVFLNGNFVKSGGNLVRGTGSGPGTIRFDGAIQTYSNNSSITSAVNFSVENGSTLDLGTSFLSGTGAFTLATGGTLNVGSIDAAGAIQLGTAGGNIRMSGTRTYLTGSTVIYNGAGTQFMAAGHPVNSNTTLDNNDTVYMVSNVTINGSLTTVAPLIIDANTLTLGGDYIPDIGFLGYIPGSNLIVNGTGDMANLLLAPVLTQSPPNPMNNLTINRTGTVTLTRDLIVGGTFTLTNGTLLLGEPIAFSLTLRGNVVRTAGTLAVINNPNLTIEGTGTLPASFPITLQTPASFIGQLTMNRAAATFTTSSAISLDTLLLFNGVVNHPSSNLTMRSGGLVLRQSGGSIIQTLGAQTNYDVEYEVVTDITSGNELPATATALRNLTKRGVARVLLNKDIIVNGRFTIEEGTFDAGVGNDITIRENFVVDGTFEPQQGLVTFAGSASQTISGTDTASFYNIQINQPVVNTITISTKVLVENNLAVNSGSVLNTGTDQLRLLSGPTKTANVSQLATGAVINGRVIVERYLPKVVQRRNYFHIASPVTNSNLADWNTEIKIARAFQWNEATDVYQQVPVSTATPSGKGFTVDFQTVAPGRVDSRGTLRQGNIGVPVTTQSPGVVQGPDGWNLLGNPYPAAIDWDKVVLPAEVYDAVYVWDNFGNSGQGTDPGQIVSFVDGVGTPLGYDGEIAQGQAFWVKAIGNGTLTFTEAVKGTFTDANFYRKPEIQNILRITLGGEGLKDEAVVRLREGATEKFDGNYDAYKYLKEGFRISTLTSDNVKAVINALGTSSCDQLIQLATEEAQNGSYTLDFTGMESFDSFIAISLIDQVEKKTIDIRNQPVYSFTVTDDNIELMPSRFQISLGANAPIVNTSIVATGETLCEDNSVARIMLEGSESGVQYSVEWNGTKISEPIPGTGSPIQLDVNIATLAIGENNVTVRAQAGVCSGSALTTMPVITKVKRGEIKSIQEGSVCNAGIVNLRVSGADEDGWYQWYERIDDSQPIVGAQGSEFTTPSLVKSKTYYVAVVNALGCEGTRKAVTATVSYPQEVTVTAEGSTLISSAAEGNQWFLNGNLLENATSNTLQALASGVYTVNATNGGCTSIASIEFTGEEGEMDAISVFPNPTADKVYIRVKSANNNVTATMVNSQGVELGTKELVGENGFKEAEFDLLPYATGIYNVKVLDGHKVVIKKIAKIE